MTKTLITEKMAYLKATEQILARLGPVEYAPDVSTATLKPLLANIEILIATKNAPVTKQTLSLAPKLRIIGVPTLGYDWVDVDAATAFGIPVVVNLGAPPNAVAEFALGAVLALTRRIAWADRAMRTEAPWAQVRSRFADPDQLIGVELTRSVVGILGLGNIGAAVAKIIQVLRPERIIGYDPLISAQAAADIGVVLASEANTVIREADILLLHLPLVERTRGLLSAQMISTMKTGALVVNCARGEIVDQDALVDALVSGKLGGAALDVYAQEPLPSNSPLRSLDNVLLTPHIAGVTIQSDWSRGELIAHRVTEALSGRRPAGLVNPQVWDSFSRTALTEPEIGSTQ